MYYILCLGMKKILCLGMIPFKITRILVFYRAYDKPFICFQPSLLQSPFFSIFLFRLIQQSMRIYYSDWVFKSDIIWSVYERTFSQNKTERKNFTDMNLMFWHFPRGFHFPFFGNSSLIIWGFISYKRHKIACCFVK